MSDSQHHPFCPSQLGRRLLCPASYALELEAQECGLVPPSSDAAEEGTRLHALVPPDQPLPDGEDGELVEWARMYLGDLGGGGEFEIPVALYNANEMLFRGTVDWVNREKRLSVDFKFGRALPSVETIEPQKRGYAAALMQQLQADTWEARVFHVRSGTEWVGRYENLPGLVLEFAQIIERAKRGGPAVPGPTQCQFCSARPICPSFQALASDLVILEPKPTSVSLLQRAAEIYQVVKPWVEDFRRLLSSLPDETIDQLGYERKTRSVRKVRSVEEAFESAGRWLSQVDFLRLCSVSQTAVGKALKEKGVTKAEVDQVINGICDRVEQVILQRKNGGEE